MLALPAPQKSQMLQSSLPLPGSFFKVLLLPQKFNRFHRFRFHIPASGQLCILLQCFTQMGSSGSNLKTTLKPTQS